MKKKRTIVRYTDKELAGMEVRGEDRTDWNAVRAKTEEQLGADIADDPAWEGVPEDWVSRAHAAARLMPAPAGLAVAPLIDTSTIADRAYAALKHIILSLDIYDRPGEVRLDERQLAGDLGISRTPVREAMVQLEREGFVRSVPRRGIYVVRKSKAEVVELITAWAALESMAARLITENAPDGEIATLRAMFATFEDGRLQAKLDEYSQVNIEFHQTIIRMSRNRVLIDLAANLFAHMRMIRRKTIGEHDRADRSIRDHMNIIQSIEARDTARAEALVRDHALGLADHVARHADYLDDIQAQDIKADHIKSDIREVSHG